MKLAEVEAYEAAGEKPQGWIEEANDQGRTKVLGVVPA
jgi:hypothetical protein